MIRTEGVDHDQNDRVASAGTRGGPHDSASKSTRPRQPVNHRGWRSALFSKVSIGVGPEAFSFSRELWHRTDCQIFAESPLEVTEHGNAESWCVFDASGIVQLLMGFTRSSCEAHDQTDVLFHDASCPDRLRPDALPRPHLSGRPRHGRCNRCFRVQSDVDVCPPRGHYRHTVTGRR